MLASLSVCWRVCRCVGESVGVLASLSVCWRVCRCVGESASTNDLSTSRLSMTSIAYLQVN